MNEIESIQILIKKVDNVISSIKEGISKYPEDKILPLSLNTFETLKKELLYDIELEKDKTLEEELKHIQKVIIENKQFQKENPSIKKELEKMLKGFERYENQLLAELNQHSPQDNLNIKMETKNF